MKRQSKVVRYILFIILIIVWINPVFAQAPQIADWSSNGSGAANPQDIMYLVNQGETITFTVFVDQTVDYEWQVNKVVQTTSDSSFTWTVPNQASIWEIHIKISNINGEDHMELTVSTLSISNAPDYFDYFTDLRLHDRTDIDPWDRPLPEWQGDTGYFDAFAAYLTCNDGYYHSLYLNSNITHGTWEFKMRFPQAYTGAPQSYVYLKPLSNTESMQFTHKNDNHVYFWDATQTQSSFLIHLLHSGTPGGAFPYGNTDDGINDVDDQWHTVKIIRKPDGTVYIFQDDLSVLYGPVKTNEMISERFIFKTMYSGDHKPFIDNVKVYDEEYLFPEKEIIYNDVENRIILHGGADNPHRFSEIAQAIGNNSIFEYNNATKTATSHAHIQLRSAAALLIDDETLQFNTSTSNLELRLFISAEIYIFNSTITTTHSNYFQFMANSDFLIKMDNSVLNNVHAYWHNPNDMFDNFVKNSTINIAGGYFRLAGGIPKNILIENNTFTGLSSSQMIIFERAGENPNVSQGNGNKQYKTEIIIKDNVFVDLEVRSQYGRTTQLINCELAGTSYLYPRSTGDYDNHFVVKYYLDVEVIDGNSNPVPDAIVNVTNEIDNTNYPTQNVFIVTADDYSEEQNENWGPYDSTITGEHGHTSLPSNPIMSFVITDLKESWDIGTMEYTYTITADKDGITADTTGVNPDSLWYRAYPDSYPGVPEKGTITITLPVEITDTTDLSRILIYPNPYREDQGWSEHITFDNLPAETTIRIYTLSGDLVKMIEHQAQTDGGIEEWDISDITNGVYIYSVKSASGNRVGKVSIIK